MNGEASTPSWWAKARAVLAGTTVTAVVATGMVLGSGGAASAADLLPGPAPIEQRNAQTVTADPLPTVQIDSGIVWAQVVAGDTVFAGGSFSNARPAGAAPGESLMARSNILAYDIDTGVATSFAPTIEGTVKSLAVSPDGKTLYVGGSFTKVNGQTRYNVAAFDIATGALSSSFKPAVGGSYVNAIVATGSTVYVGGLIGAAGGVTRKNLAAVAASNGAVLAWAPTTDLQVDTMVMEPGNGKLIVGGRFGQVNGVSQRGLVALDLSDGSILPWAAPATVVNGSSEQGSAGKAGIWALTADDTAVYGTGWVFANKWVGNLEGMFSAEAGSGDIRWIADCHGDHYGIYSDGTNVYSTSHEHDCQTAGGLPQASPAPGNMRHATAWTAAAKGTLTTSPSVNDIYADWGGYPAPAAVNWYPDWTTGTASGQGQAGWTATGNGKYLLIGGEFPYVNGQRSQGIARFSNQPATGAKQGPRLSGANWTPSARSVSAGTARVAIAANWDRDDRDLTYDLYEQGKATPVATAQKSSTFWNTPTVVLTASGLAAGATKTYRVVARDGDGNTANSAWVTVTVSSADASDYANAVLDDGASLLWRLGGDDGGADWAGTNDAVLTSGVVATDDDALAGEQNGAAAFPGAGQFARTTTTATVGSSWAAELWFKTNTTTGGKILGYGDASSGDSGSYDRHVYMRNDGRLVLGVYPGWAATVQSQKAYNDNKWHQVVAQQSTAGGLQLYVDGQLVGSDATVTAAQSYTGYWRIGGDNLNGWPNQPSTAYFRGDIDEFAVYGSALATEQIAEHYSIARGPHTAPVAVIDTDAAGQTVTFSGLGSTVSSDADLTGYAWSFGDGATSTEPTPTHRYATAGTYAVTLVVTDSTGSSSQAATTDVTVGAAASPTARYTQRVLDDGAQVYWRLGGELGGIDWIGDNDAVFAAGVGSSADDVYTGPSSGSATFDGASAFGRTRTTMPATTPFAAEVWFKTTTTSGGKIFGYGASADGNSSNYDRHLYMADNGRLVFGVWLGWAATVQSTASYNDGQWHHVIAQVGSDGEKLFVDGQLVGSDAGVTGAQDYSGYWRIGGDNIGGWPSQPSSFYFSGQLDDFAAYGRTFSSAEAEDHYLIATGAATPQAQIEVSGTGTARTFDGSSSTAPSGRTITGYAWDFGDGATASGATAAHTYGAPGDYTVSLTVTDSAGRTGVATTNVTVPPPHAAPVAAIGHTADGLTVAFDSDDSTASDGAAITGYSWDFGDGGVSAAADPTHVYAAPGDYQVSLIVTDELGMKSTAAVVQVTVEHADPTASFTVSATGLVATVDASGSTAADDATLSYSWNWGDGTAADVGVEASHTYASSGSYDVVLTVTDSLGSTDTTTKTVTVTAQNIVARDDFERSIASGWGTAQIGGTWTSLAATSVSGGAGRISLNAGQTKSPVLSSASGADLTARLSVSFDKVADGGGLHFSYALHKSAAGDYRLKVRTLSTGAVTASLTKVVGSTETTLATRTLTGYTLTAGATLNLAFETSTTGTSTALRGSVWPAGTSEPTAWQLTAADATASLQGAGQIGVIAYLSGSTTNTPVVVSVDDVTVVGAGPGTAHTAPVAQIGATASGLSASFDGTGSTATGGASITGYAWQFGDGATSTAAKPTHTYASAGTYTATLVVTDSLGASSAAATKQIVVAHTDPAAAFSAQASGLTVAVDASATTVADGATATYSWNWGDGGASGHGVTASHTYATAGEYTVTLTVTDDLGGSDSVSHAVSVASSSFVAKDDFDRSVASGWGSAPTGGAWGTTTGFSVSDGVGKATLAAGQTRTNLLTTVSARDVDARLTFSSDKLANGGGLQFNYLVRKTAAGDYRLKLRISATGTVIVSIAKVVGSTETLLVNRTLTGYTHSAGGALDLRLQAASDGDSTTLRANVWTSGTTEPSGWFVSTTDGQAELQGAGQVGILSYLSGSATNAPLVVSVDGLEVR